MTKLSWDQVGERLYETGVSNGVLYLPNNVGNYVSGYAWNGLTTITESPAGAESNKTYADNRIYANLISAETFGGTIEAYTFPKQFAQCDGSTEYEGVYVGQQTRKTFGLCYKTLLGNDVALTDFGYKLHLVWGATVAPSEKAFATVNDSPEALNFSWEFSTIGLDVGTVGGVDFKPTSSLVIPSNEVDAAALAELEDLLYGTSGTDAQLPLPAAVLTLFTGSITTTAAVTAPTYNSSTHVITIPTVTGVLYQINGVTKTGTVTITESTVVDAVPAAGYKFPIPTDDDWLFTYV